MCIELDELDELAEKVILFSPLQTLPFELSFFFVFSIRNRIHFYFIERGTILASDGESD